MREVECTPVFADTLGREWRLNLTVGRIRRVKELVGVDLWRILDRGGVGLAELIDDLKSFVDVLWVLVMDIAEPMGIADVQFAEGLGRETIEKATDAFVAGVLDFFPEARIAPAIRAIANRTLKATSPA